MPYRITPLINQQFYHVFNRGVAKQPIFNNKREYDHFLTSLNYYKFKNIPIRFSRFLKLSQKNRQHIVNELETKAQKLVNITCYALMPNHFHLLVQQINDNGISLLLSRLCNSYSKYFNTKNYRVGPLFQGSFKVVRVSSDEQLLHVSRYIHLNPVVSYIVTKENLIEYPWSSLSYYLTKTGISVDSQPILDHFSGPEEYQKFIFDQIDYAKTLKQIEHLSLEK